MVQNTNSKPNSGTTIRSGGCWDVADIAKLQIANVPSPWSHQNLSFALWGDSRLPDHPGWGAAAPPKIPVVFFGGGGPRTRGVWGAEAPPGATFYISYRPKTSSSNMETWLLYNEACKLGKGSPLLMTNLARTILF